MNIPTDHVSEEVQLLLAVGITLASEATGSINKYLQAMSLEDLTEEPEIRLECEPSKKKTAEKQHLSPTSNCLPCFNTPESFLTAQMKQTYEFLLRQTQDEDVSALLTELEDWKAKNEELEAKIKHLMHIRDVLRMSRALLGTKLPKHTEECILQDDSALG